jgi:hypothetical protein
MRSVGDERIALVIVLACFHEAAKSDQPLT